MEDSVKNKINIIATSGLQSSMYQYSGMFYFRIFSTYKCNYKIEKMIHLTLYAKGFDCVDHNELWKILKEMGIPDHLTYLLRNLYADQEATVRTGHGTADCFQIGKGVHQGPILSPCLFNLYAEYIMRNAGLEEAQAGSRLPGEISITSDMQMTPPLWQKVKRN